MAQSQAPLSLLVSMVPIMTRPPRCQSERVRYRARCRIQHEGKIYG